jgi:NitT/TauT family transport system ATP-binding protein
VTSQPTDLATATTSAFLEIRGVRKTFPGRHRNESRVVALDNVNLSVADREFLAIVGPSGCGKSTLLRIIDGLDRPDSGQVLLRGRPVVKPGLDRGVVFQAPNLLPWRTVRRNIEFGLESLGLPKAERRRRSTELLEIVGLVKFAEFYPKQLSGGMQQRVGLARALAIDPTLLLMDEPFGAVDAQTKLVLQEELERIWLRTEKAVVFITHDIDEAIFLADRVVVMSPGPGRIIDEVTVPFPRSRDFDVRGTPEFAALVRRVLDGLRSQAGTFKRGQHDPTVHSHEH